MAVIKLTFTEDNSICIEGLGSLTGTVEYETGYTGSLEQPPDPPELGLIQLRDALGIDIPNEIWESEENYNNLLLALQDILSWDYGTWNAYCEEESEKYWDKTYDELYDNESEVDNEVPF